RFVLPLYIFRTDVPAQELLFFVVEPQWRQAIWKCAKCIARVAAEWRLMRLRSGDSSISRRLALILFCFHCSSDCSLDYIGCTSSLSLGRSLAAVVTPLSLAASFSTTLTKWLVCHVRTAKSSIAAWLFTPLITLLLDSKRPGVRIYFITPL